MVVLPKEIIETKYPGYFFNIDNEMLYSVKVVGMLKPLGKCFPNVHNHFRTGWKVSVKGERRWLDLSYLQRLKAAHLKTPPTKTIFPVWPA